MDLCSMMCVFPNTKVHGVLMMLSTMKPEKKFSTIAGTFVFHHVSRTTILRPLSSADAHANALQQVDVILTLLHSFIKHDGSCIYIYMFRAI